MADGSPREDGYESEDDDDRNQIARAHEASRRVSADLLASLDRDPEIVAVYEHGAVRIKVAGVLCGDGSGLDGTDDEQLAVEIAGAAQEWIAGSWTVWPMCARHSVGVHPELVEGQAAWVCRLGRHSTPIGQLSGLAP